MKNFRLLIIFPLLVLFSSSIVAQPGLTLISHDFEASADGWVAGGSVGNMDFVRISSPSPFSAQGNSTTVWTTSPFNNYGNNDGAYVNSSSIDMTLWTAMTLSIDVRYNTEQGWDGMNIYYSTDDFANHILLGAVGEGTNWFNNTGVDGIADQFGGSDPHGWSGDNSAWQTATIPIPAGLEGNPNVRFRVFFGSDGSTRDDGIAFDNVIITGTLENTTCYVPTSLGSASVTTSDATISWTDASPPPAVGYDYYYSPSATDPDINTTVSGSVTNPAVSTILSGLTPGTLYYYWVRGNCGVGDVSAWTSSSNFTTLVVAPTVTSFTPTSGCASETVIVITGSNFGGTSAVTIGGTAVSSYTVDSDTQITATVGTGTTGVVLVTNSGGSDDNGVTFTFNSDATIDTNPVDASILTGNSFDLTVAATGAAGYQWEYSANGTTGWASTSDGTPANVTYTGSTTTDLTISASTSIAASTAFYRCVVSCGSVASTAAEITFVAYCPSSGGVVSGIKGVSLTGTSSSISNLNTGITSYTDYSATYQASLLREEDYTLNVYINTDGNYTHYVTVWIDWNQDGDYLDASEEYNLGTATNVSNNATTLSPVTISVPSTAEVGFCKMRVMSRESASSSGASCVSFTYGEVEDYGINVDYIYNWAGTVNTAWENKDNWTNGITPDSDNSIIVPDVTNQPVITTDITIADLTINALADLTISSNFLTVTGSTDVNGTMNIGNGTVNADGVFDATTGTIDMTNANANLVLSSTVTSLGTLDAAMGTVTYDGGVQSVLSDSYNNLSISTAGTKTAAGNVVVNGNLTTAATANSKLDMSTYDLNIAGDLTVGATDGLDVSDALSLVTFDGSSDQIFTHSGASQVSSTVTLVSEDFNSFSTGALTESVSTSSTYQNVANCTTEKWEIETTDIPYAGSCSGCSGNRAHIEFVGSSCTQDNTIITAEFSPTTSSLDISFNYAVRHWTGQYFEVYLYNVTDATQVGTDLINITSSVDNQTYSAQTTLSGSNSTSDTYSLRFHYYGNNDYGAQFDNVLIQEDALFSGSELNNFTINKTSGNVTLNDDILADGTLTLTAGYIDASSNNLALTSAATISGGSDASHVIGTMVKTTTAASAFTFPLGDGTWYKAIGITPDATSSTVWTAKYFNSEYPTTTVDPANTGDIDHISAYEYWDLDKVGSANAVIALPWVSQNAVSVYADLRLAHFDGTDWDMIAAGAVSDNPGLANADSSGVVTSNAVVTTYSPFTLASSTSSNTLPIELVSFSGEKKDNRNILNWTTASEINNAYFTVEKSYNGLDFEWVGTQEGTSPSTQIINYSLSDYDVLETLNYYRLKQTDFDGKFEYSKTISLDNRVDNSFKEIIGRTNLLGQDVDEYYNGIVIVRYKDGTSQKFYQFK